MASIGTVIRTLRREKNLTQEGLADLLNITAQAVSKWENDTGLPDVSQIVPLSRIFGVTTDTLFGLGDFKSEKERIAEHHEATFIRYEVDESTDAKRKNYHSAIDIHKEFPNNYYLILCCMTSAGVYLQSAIDNEVMSDEEKREIVTECERWYSCIMNYSRNIEYMLDANYWMCHLYGDLGEFDKARRFADIFPVSATTKGEMNAWIFRDEKNLDGELKQRIENVHRYIGKMIEESVLLTGVYDKLKKFREAIYIRDTVIEFMRMVRCDSELDLFCNLSNLARIYIDNVKSYMKLGEYENALTELESAFLHVKRATELQKSSGKDGEWYEAGYIFTSDSPFLNGISRSTSNLLQAKWFYKHYLLQNEFDLVRENPRFIAICEGTKNLM